MDRELRNFRYKELYKLYKNFNKEILLTFQYNNTLPREIKTSEHKSYDWLKDRIGFYPIWTLRLKPNLDYDSFEKQISSALAIDRPYVFLISTDVEDLIDTSLYQWVEVHYIENAQENELIEDDYRVQKMYNDDWEKFLAIDEHTYVIQTLINPAKLKDSDIIQIYEQPNEIKKEEKEEKKEKEKKKETLRKMAFI